MSVQRAQSEITSTEFLDWVVFLEQERSQRFDTIEKGDYYLAQISAEIRRRFVKHLNRVSLQILF